MASALLFSNTRIVIGGMLTADDDTLGVDGDTLPDSRLRYPNGW
jgi:hypothetical protein